MTAPDPVDLAQALRPSILRMSRRLRQEATHGDGLTANDVMLLAQIRKRPGLGVSALAEMERTSQPTISAHVKRLEAVGLVTRIVDPEDARRSGLSITPLAARKLDAVRRRRNDWLAARLAALSPEERKRLAEAAEALTHLAETQ